MKWFGRGVSQTSFPEVPTFPRRAKRLEDDTVQILQLGSKLEVMLGDIERRVLSSGHRIETSRCQGVEFSGFRNGLSVQGSGLGSRVQGPPGFMVQVWRLSVPGSGWRVCG